MEVLDKDLLRHIPLFATLSEDQLDELAGMLTCQKFNAEQPIFWVGDEGSDFYVIQFGHVTVSFPDEAGGEVTLPWAQ